MELKQWSNEKAVSSVIGIVLILAITILSIAIIILYTSPTLNNLEDIAEAQKVEQAFTVFDSRASKASLGESPVQITRVNQMGGKLEVMGDTRDYNNSQIMVLALNSNSSWYQEFYNNRTHWNSWEKYKNESDFAGYSSPIPMGKIKYTSGDRTIAYEGGGVWSKYGNGGTIMISPPEFHYNIETLTLPVMRISGNTSVSGISDTSITVASSNKPVVLFPNVSLNNNFTNPIKADNIIIYIQSEFYEGWGEYAESLTSTSVALDHENQTAVIELETLPPMGTFALSNSFKIIKLNASNPDPMYNFSFYFQDEDGEASNFQSVTTTITATSGTKNLRYIFSKNDSVVIEYTDSSVGTEIEKWATANSSSFPIYEDKSANPPKLANLTLDLLSHDYVVKYDNKKVDDFSWNETSQTTMLPNVTITYGDVYPLYNVTNHYMKLLAQDGIIACSWAQGNNNKIQEDISDYTLVYDSGGGIITFLHITSNELHATVS
jgi:hypothetical protein